MVKEIGIKEWLNDSGLLSGIAMTASLIAVSLVLLSLPVVLLVVCICSFHPVGFSSRNVRFALTVILEEIEKRLSVDEHEDLVCSE